MSQQQNIQPNRIKKLPLFAKASFGILFSLMLAVTSVGLATQTTHAAASTVDVTHDTSTTALISQVFGSYANQAIAIATCESSLNPNATNSYAIGNSHAEGLFQILYPSTWYTTSEASASPYNATANTEAAYQIFSRDGYTWREWECQP